ncbi:MAG: DegV family protein [Clostridia bacterium]|nr:DegV family protein [Clostridia bacterium]
MNYTIFTDSSSGLPLQITKNYDFKIIPLTCIIDGEETQIRCDDETFLKDFYQKLRLKADMSTACINEQTFYDYFKQELNCGNDIIYIGLSSGLSATIDNAKKVSALLEKEFPKRKVYIVDSLNACLGEGLLVYTACIKKSEGLSAQEVYDHLLNVCLNANSLFTVKTLAYLAKGGRISKASMLIGTVVDIKPVMHVNRYGKLVASKKVIGRKRSVMAIAEDFCKMVKRSEEQTIFIGHGDCIEDAELLATLISKKVKVKEFVFNYIDPVIAIHSGPDTLAVFGYGLSRAESEENVEAC